MSRTPARVRPSLSLRRRLTRYWAPSILAALVAVSCSERAYQGPYKHVLLITLDTTRADQLGCYGAMNGATPRLDSLAKEATLFRDVTCTAPTTLASHTSIMTGLYPRRHGVPRNGFMVDEQNIMLAEVLGSHGFRTAGFLGSFALDQMFGFDQGFLSWDQEFDVEAELRLADQDQRRAEAVTDAVLAYVDRVDVDQRLFLFAHYFDAHAPYDPPAPYGERFVEPGAPTTSNLRDVSKQEIAHQNLLQGPRRVSFNEGLSIEQLEQSGGEPLPGDELLAALYAGEMNYMDHHLGRLFDGLRERGVYDECVVLVTADHGETFWEHGDVWHHGAWVYETNVRVPLIVRLPDGRGAGRAIDGVNSTIDIFPTLLELLELPLPEAVDGESLLAAIDGAQLPERAVFSEATQPVNEIELREPWRNQWKPRAVRRGRWKYVEAPYLGYSQLFDLDEDPGERVNLLRDSTPLSRAELPILQRELERWSATQSPRPSEFNSTQTEEVERRLGNLGYTGENEEDESMKHEH